MNILYISHSVPFPPDKGEKIRAFHQIRYLSREHTIHLACLITDPKDANHLKNMEEYCASVDAAYRNPRIATLLSGVSVIAGKPFSVGSFYSRDLKRRSFSGSTLRSWIAFSSLLHRWRSMFATSPRFRSLSIL